jgi:uncharacterized SAM-binding protein YcdF (DUF218 family)
VTRRTLYGMQSALALVVPGNGRFDRSGGYRISAACRRLVGEAERLAERLAPQAVVFSGWSPVGGASEAEQMRCLWRGPDVELLVESTAATTAENAARTLPFLVERHIRHAFVVCTPLHLYRTRWFFHRLYQAHGIEASFHVARVAPTPAALAWELGALTVRSRQLRVAQEELERRL